MNGKCYLLGILHRREGPHFCFDSGKNPKNLLVFYIKTIITPNVLQY